MDSAEKLDSESDLFNPGKQAYSRSMIETQQLPAIDWTDCPIVESVPGKVSGVPILVGTRVQADSILENYEGGSPIEEISDNFDIPEETIRELLAFAANQDSLRQQ
jgi:uncharacterized protein (DUF433 family)